MKGAFPAITIHTTGGGLLSVAKDSPQELCGMYEQIVLKKIRLT